MSQAVIKYLKSNLNLTVGWNKWRGKYRTAALGRNALLKTHKIGTDLWFCVNLLDFFFSFIIIIINDNTSYFQTILHLKVFQIIEPPSHRMIAAGGAQSAVP